MSEENPQEGGSYIRNADGTLTKVADDPLPNPLPQAGEGIPIAASAAPATATIKGAK